MDGLPPPVRSAVETWIEGVVIAQALCPFAARPYADGEVHLEVLPVAHDRALTAVYKRATQMVQHASPETTLFIDAGHSLDPFSRFLTFQSMAEELLEQHFPKTYVTAGFHPDYRFADVDDGDVTHAIHQSPVPIVQLLRCDSVAFAKTHHDVGAILERNRVRAAELGAAYFARYRG